MAKHHYRSHRICQALRKDGKKSIERQDHHGLQRYNIPLGRPRQGELTYPGSENDRCLLKSDDLRDVSFLRRGSNWLLSWKDEKKWTNGWAMGEASALAAALYDNLIGSRRRLYHFNIFNWCTQSLGLYQRHRLSFLPQIAVPMFLDYRLFAVHVK